MSTVQDSDLAFNDSAANGTVVTQTEWNQNFRVLKNAINDNYNHITSGSSIQIINVKTYGAAGNRVTDDTQAIQSALNAVSSTIAIVYFPAGTYIVSSPLTILSNTKIEGEGWSSVIYCNSASAVGQIFQTALYSTTKYVEILDITVESSTASGAHGFYLYGLQYSSLVRVHTPDCAGTGIFLDGNASNHCSTVFIEDCEVLKAGNYGIYTSGYADDIHVIDGNYGLAGADGVYIGGPSSRVRGSVINSCQGSGVNIGSSAPSCQIEGCNLEGNKKHGVEVHASHVYVSGNKIYDNANTSATYGTYDGVYVNGTSSASVENVHVVGNTIYAGLYSSTGYYRYAINLDAYHTHCEVDGNKTDYALSNGSFNGGKAINGVADGDTYNGAYISTTANRLASPAEGQRAIDTSLNKPIWFINGSWVDATGAAV